MRILIQDPVGKGYFDGATWAGDPEQAQEFESVAQAESYCLHKGVTSALIVVKFNDPEQDIRYPIGPQDALLISKPATTRISSIGH